MMSQNKTLLLIVTQRDLNMELGRSRIRLSPVLPLESYKFDWNGPSIRYSLKIEIL